MRNFMYKLGTLSVALAVIFASGSIVAALPAQASAHAQSVSGVNINGNVSNGSSVHATSANSSHGSSASASAKTNAQSHLAAAKLKACQNRQKAINTIMTRIKTRAQNQIKLFSTIATRVEGFYTKQGKTLSTYSQLVASVHTAESQANTDFGSMQNVGTLDCSGNNPKAMVSAFQSYLKTEITDLQNFRTAVKNLIVGVATANNVQVSTTAGTTQASAAGTSNTSTSTTQGGN